MRGNLVLALDSATDRLSVALVNVVSGTGDGGDRVVEVLAERGEGAGRATSKRLLPVVEACLADGQVTVGELGAVVVGVGPGTFTGVRIAVAAARALALALDIPVLGVPTPAALAAEAAAGLGVHGSPFDNVDLLVPVVDARRGQVFAGIYGRTEDGHWERRAPYRALAPEALEAEVAFLVERGEAVHPVVLGYVAAPAVSGGTGLHGALGEGAPWASWVACEVRASFLVAGQQRLTEPGETCTGDRLAPALAALLEAGRPAAPATERVPGALGTPESVVPLYVRPPDADEHILRMRDPFAA